MTLYDTGVAAERTRLSRHRTSLTAITCCLTVLHLTLSRAHTGPDVFLATSALLVVGARLQVLSLQGKHCGPTTGVECLGIAAAVSAIGVAILVPVVVA